MRKLLTTIACLTLTGALLSACGSDTDKKTTEPTKEPTTDQGTTAKSPEDDLLSKKITISIYYPSKDKVEDRKLEDDKIRRFTEKYPNVTVEKATGIIT